MAPRDERLSGRPLVRLGLYAVVLVAALGGGAAAGALVGPDGSTDVDASHDDDAHAEPSESAVADRAVPAGVTTTAGGYTLDLRTRSVDGRAASDVELAILDTDGRPLTDYEIGHDRELHLVVVGRNLDDFAHVHPQRDGSGAWTAQLPALPPGSYRVFADFVPGGAEDGVTLGADLAVLGAVADAAVPAPSSSDSVGGYDVTFDADLVAGATSTLTVIVSRDGEPVEDLQPYLGALGHLVAVRDGDLAYLHVHPLDDLDGPGGPAVRFAVEVPSTGTYGLFFDFSHDGTVRTASVTATAVEATAGASVDDSADAGAPGADHDG